MATRKNSVATKKSNSNSVTNRIVKFGTVLLEHVYAPISASVYFSYIAANHGVNTRLAAPSLMPSPDVMAPFWANRSTWSRSSLKEIRNEFATLVLRHLETDPTAQAVLSELLSHLRAGRNIGLAGFAQERFMWTDMRALVLAALIRKDHEVANHVARWTGIQTVPINRPAIESTFERAWGLGLYDNNIVTDPEVLKS